MKKILLASTILVGSAGIAAAEVTFEGAGGFGVDSADGGATWGVYHDLELNIAFVGTTDGGLEFGATWDLTSDNVHNWDDNYELYISGDFGKVTVGEDGGDTVVGYTHTFGDFGVGANYNVTTTAWDIELSYDFGDYDVALTHDSAGVTGVEANADFGDFSVGVAVSDVSAFSTSWELTGGWSSGAVSVDVSFDASNAWSLEGAYDLGGGASVEASFDSAGAYKLGVAMEF